ncbi:MAG TPA: PLP-dependent transferase, partial [Polyangiaceae bacterium]|nr:PLP-dependent transferase [Polyangiaceae bacterium]
SIAREQMSGFGGVVSFIVRGGKAAASRVVDASRLAQIAPSLGGVETLIEQPTIMSYFELNDEQLSQIDMSPSLIRLAVGIEDEADLLEDLARALEA